MSNPTEFLARRNFKIPEGMNNPNDIMQHLLNTGQISQQQMNNAMQMRNNPLVQKLFGGK